MQGATVRRTTYGPAPAGFFITSKLVDEVPSLKASGLHDRVMALLTAAESDLFAPLLMLSSPADFAQNFELLSYKYFPLRIQVLMLILDCVGVKRFRAEYFQRAPQFAASLAIHANAWGLDVKEVSLSFHTYFECAIKLADVAPLINCAEPAQLLRLLDPITRLDYGFTALGLVFEGTIKTNQWCVAEVFRCTHEPLRAYGDAVENVINHIRQIDLRQGKLFAERSATSESKPTPKKLLPIRSSEPSLNKKAHERYSEFEDTHPW